MGAFVESFWGEDIAAGSEALFEQLRRGCEQNELFIQLFASRMQFEVAHGRQLCGIETGVDSFDGAETTVGAALRELLDQTVQEGAQHLAIAANIESTVLSPFSRWCEGHRERVEESEKAVRRQLTSLGRARRQVEKLEQTYFNKCRAYEDYKREQLTEEELAAALEALQLQRERENQAARDREFQEFGSFGPTRLDLRSARELVHALLTRMEKHEYRVPLINYVFQGTNNGSEIARFLYEYMSLEDLDEAEAAGQDLLNKGFLKYCNGVGGGFVNSKKFQYQWKPYAYEFARVANQAQGSEEAAPPGDTDSDLASVRSSTDTNRFSLFVQDFTSRITSADSAAASVHSREAETPSPAVPQLTEQQKILSKLGADVEKADANYRRECSKLDMLRCSTEELMMEHYATLEQSERERLEMLKNVTLDFCATIGNKIASMKIAIERMISCEHSMDPAADLLTLVQRYRTGAFQPKVVPYNNYYNPGGFQIFGIDLETRCRLDKKVVPVLVSSILSYMDQLYPDMPDDHARATVWTASVRLQYTHHLRKLINEKPGSTEDEIFRIFGEANAEPSHVASVLKLYLLELPVPLISNDIYDVMRGLYTEFPPGSDADEDQRLVNSQRVQGVINTLSTLSKPRVATLDVLTNHFYRLIKIIRMSDSQESKDLADHLVAEIAKEFAPCIIKACFPVGPELGRQIFADLLMYKKQIFRDLKRQGSRRKTSGSTAEESRPE
ncbi:AaceriABR241Cp [[Ashbya] aceris (nom. inval.)]|nr:AaceriABR241Cp [[Ashbya] aceris (nom. inval.)]